MEGFKVGPTAPGKAPGRLGEAGPGQLHTEPSPEAEGLAVPTVAQLQLS